MNRFESKILSMSRCGSMLMTDEDMRRRVSEHKVSESKQWETQTNQSRVTLMTTNRSVVQEGESEQKDSIDRELQLQEKYMSMMTTY